MGFIINSYRHAGEVIKHTTFDGTNENIYAGAVSSYSFIQNTDIFAFSVWIKLNDYTADAIYGIMGSGGYTTSKRGFSLRWENRSSQGSPARLQVEVVRASAGNYVNRSLSSTNIISDNNWHHIFFSSNSTNSYLYVDDSLDSLSSETHSTTSTGNSSYVLDIGSAGNNQQYFNGSIDKYILYDAHKSSTDATSAYNYGRKAGLIGIGNEVSQWELDTLNPTDEIGSNNGTSNNMDSSNIVVG